MTVGADEALVVRAAIRDELSKPVEEIREELRRLGEEADRTGRKASASSSGWDRLNAGVGRMVKTAGRTAVYALGGLTTALGVATGAAVTLGVKTAANMQTAKVAFTTMLGSAQKANRFLRDLAKFAASTPFEFPELQTAASSLISAGIHANKVIPIMTSLGNATAGMGTGSEGIQRATVALQQMNAAGKITGEDLNQLRDAGIPVFDLLAAATGKSKKEVAALAQAGKLGGRELTQLMHALETGKGLERFNGLMEKQSHTLTGVWSTLKDTVQMGLAKALAPAVPMLTDLTLAASDLAQRGMGPLKDGLAVATRDVRRFYDAFKQGGTKQLSDAIGFEFGDKAQAAFDKAIEVAGDLAKILTDSLVPAFGDAATVTGNLSSPLAAADDILGFMADHTTATRVAIEGLVVAYTAARIATAAWAASEAVSLFWLKAHTEGTKTQLVWSKAAALGAGAWAAAQWVLNAALTANPIGLIIVGIAALIAIFVLAYKKVDWFRDGINFLFTWVKSHWPLLLGILTGPIGALVLGFKAAWEHSETFRRIVTGALDAVGDGIGWLLDKFGDMLDALSHVPGFGWAKKAADAMHNAADKARELADNIRDIPGRHPVDIPVTIRAPRADNLGNTGRNRAIVDALRPTGDTLTSKARGGALGIANTLAAHQATMAATGARPAVSNVYTGGGGTGRGSGDHQAGRALDLVGKGLDRYGAHMRALGGFAEFHGTGTGRHLHVVPPAMGDTRTSMANRVTRPAPTPAPTRSAPSITIAPGAIVVQNPASGIDLERAIAAGIEAYVRDQQERS